MTDDENTPEPQLYDLVISDYKVQAKALTPEQLMVVMALKGSIGPSGIRSLYRILQRSVGDMHWDAITDMLVDGETTMADIMGLLKEIVDHQTADKTDG